MRIIDLNYATEKQTLATPIFNDRGEILLSRGVSLKSSLVKKLQEYGHSSVYIKDEFCEGEVIDIIKPEIRQKTINQIRKLTNLCTGSKMNTKEIQQFNTDLNMVKATLSTIVDEIFVQKDIVIELLNLKTVSGYLYEHSVSVMIHAIVLGASIGLNRKQLDELALGAVLHDIGMTFVPEEIVKKKGPLTPEESAIVKLHPKTGYAFLKENTDLGPIVRIPCLQHHERYNGSGYPNQLVDGDLHLYSKIIGLVDVFDALTSNSPYRKALPVFEALEYIMGSGGTLFDPTLVKAFILNINPYPLNTLVSLNDGSIGVVRHVNGRFFSRPIIQIIRPSQKLVGKKKINLLEENNLVIKDILQNI